MYKTSLILLLNLLQILLLYISTTSIQAAQAKLPLVLINNNGELLYPNIITEGTFENGKGFKGDVQFSRDDKRDQIFFCPLSATDDKKKIDLANSLYNKTPQTKKLLGNVDVNFETCLKKQDFKKTEIVQCRLEAKPVLYAIYDEENDTPISIPCGPQNSGKMYKHVYNICLPTKLSSRLTKFFSHIKSSNMREFYQKVPFWYEAQTVYEVCLDSDNSDTIYTKHQLFSLPLSTDEKLKNERLSPYEIGNTFYSSVDTLINLEKFYQELEETSRPQLEPDDKKSRTKVPLGVNFKAQFLVPPEDMPTAVLQKPSFHYVNIKAMSIELSILWTSIEDAIRKTLKEHSIIYDVYTGAFKVSSTRRYPKIPDIWVKIVYYDYKNTEMLNPGMAILMKNNITHDGQEVLLKSFCSIDHCELSKKEGVLRRFSYINIKDILRCCSLNQDIQDLFGLEFKNNDILEIPGLTSAKKDLQT